MNRPAFGSIRYWLPHLAALMVIAACVRLAGWQLDRAAEKDQLLIQWDSAPALSFEALARGQVEQYARIAGPGEFDSQRHVLLDNQIRNNHPGVHVFSPFRPDGTDLIVMINRGWQPFERRSGHWPEFETPPGRVWIEGRVSDRPRVGIQLGQASALNADQWPNLMTYYDQERLQEVFGPYLADPIILLEPSHAAHLTSDPWRLINMGPEKHRAYAFQWASIGLAVFLIWLTLTFRSLIHK